MGKFFAKMKCPKCGVVKIQYVSQKGLEGDETTECTCKEKYKSVPNCIEHLINYEELPIMVVEPEI